jgi:cation:H+ antiporter
VAYLSTLAGIVLLIIGGEGLVRGSVALARRLGISPLVIGVTLVGFGTSVPELVVSLDSALGGSPGIAIGNVIGTNVANVLLILGGAAVLTPIVVQRRALRRDGAVLVGATFLLVIAVFIGSIDRWMGLLWFGALATYLFLTTRAERRRSRASLAAEAGEEAIQTVRTMRPLTAALLAVTGIASIVFGAQLLVDGAVEIARQVGLSEEVIGLTLVAIGTSLPELATTIVATFRREVDIAFGNILGSCIFNILGILGITAIFSPLPIAPEILSFDIWVLTATTLVLVIFAATGWRLTRAEGGVLLAGYGVYIAVQLSAPIRSALGLP